MDLIEDILAVIGIISLILTVIRVFWVFFSSGIEWIDNVIITEEKYDDSCDYSENGTGVYPTVFNGFDEADKEFVTATLIKPESTIIKNLKIKKVQENSIMKDKLKYKTVEKIKMVSPQYPLYVITTRTEAISFYIVEWKIDFGAKASYYFYDNLRDGNNNKKGIEYSFNIISKIRKLLDLK